MAAAEVSPCPLTPQRAAGGGWAQSVPARRGPFPRPARPRRRQSAQRGGRPQRGARQRAGNGCGAPRPPPAFLPVPRPRGLRRLPLSPLAPRSCPLTACPRGRGRAAAPPPTSAPPARPPVLGAAPGRSMRSRGGEAEGNAGDPTAECGPQPPAVPLRARSCGAGTTPDFPQLCSAGTSCPFLRAHLSPGAALTGRAGSASALPTEPISELNEPFLAHWRAFPVSDCCSFSIGRCAVSFCRCMAQFYFPVFFQV